MDALTAQSWLFPPPSAPPIHFLLSMCQVSHSSFLSWNEEWMRRMNVKRVFFFFFWISRRRRRCFTYSPVSSSVGSCCCYQSCLFGRCYYYLEKKNICLDKKPLWRFLIGLGDLVGWNVVRPRKIDIFCLDRRKKNSNAVFGFRGGKRETNRCGPKNQQPCCDTFFYLIRKKNVLLCSSSQNKELNYCFKLLKCPVRQGPVVSACI